MDFMMFFFWLTGAAKTASEPLEVIESLHCDE
jgi:hypothetical protein